MDGFEALEAECGSNAAPLVLPRHGIKKVRYTHDAMIDLIIQNPWVSQNEIAAHFGYSVSWVSQIFSSDSFQARLAERKEELVDPTIRATVEERFKALVIQSLDVLRQKLERPLPLISDELALGAVGVAAKALGYGSKAAQVQVNTQFVVHVPAKALSSEDWAAQHSAPRPVAWASPQGGIPQILGPSLVEDAVLVSPRVLEPTAPAEPFNPEDTLLQELES